MTQVPSSATPPHSKKKSIVLSLGFVGMLGGAGFFYQSLFFVTTDNAQIQAKTVMLSARVSGYLTKVNVIENQKVKEGDVLAELDSRDYENTAVQMENEVASLGARVKNAESDERRLSELFKKGAISHQQYDAAQATAIELGGKLKALQSQWSQARLNLEHTKIKAPSAGVVARKSAEVGMLASVGMPLFGFVSAEERWVVANFKETEMSQIHPGAGVEISVDALPGKVFRGAIESKSAATGATFTLLPPDNATGNFTKVVQRVPVRIGLAGLSASDVDDLQAGLSAFVKVRVR